MANTSVVGELRPGALADMIWPTSRGRTGALRNAILVFAGACLLTLSAKIAVPGPVPMTLQTLAVMILGASLGLRLGLGSVALYLAEGALGLPIFTNTPPALAGLPYFLGPTGGFLLGFLASAAVIGWAADRGYAASPLRFAGALALGNGLLLALGCLWLALGATVGKATGLGLARAFEIGVRPFLLGEAIKLALAALALPLISDALGRALRRP
ncbi:MAG: biotin transporter BioY [Methylobacteriaceae bacterium]|nr:biotin transporter BioY [Methylobacteriaceae bacterium]